ncbi:MAG TPA: NrfD/PsrC family molybdoenzyme membrane anchor subunit [Opitutaceae bacterium]|nr:NrfD/PsrC family molybdoenzyme membrane anchor subunit [Opitutaceae bacterium]
MRSYLRFLRRCAGVSLKGDWRYYAWIGVLAALCVTGLNAYAKQFVAGLEITGMSDQVSWGVYIANFTFLVGMAAAAVMLVIPVYIYKNEDLHDLVIFGELLAVAAILMCLAFVTVDLGRPDRFWHLIPVIGVFHFPGSMLSWDVLVLNGYLLLNVYICGYLLYCRYQNRKPAKWFYIPFVFTAIFWAISIHTVTAFLYVGLGGRPFWNSSIVGPRFLASAFTAGPAFVILALQVVRRASATAGDGARRQPRGDTAASRRQLHRPATAADLDLLALYLPELESVSPEERRECLAGATILAVAAGDVLLYQGALDNDAFFVLKGRVVVRREEGGRYRTTRNIGPGEQFGEVSALTGTPRAATATAAEPTEVLCLPQESLRSLMRNPKMNEIITWRMGERLMISDRSLLILRAIVQVSMIINVFLLANEIFTEFYNTNGHDVSWRYLVLGLDGYHALVPWFWTALTLNIGAMVILMLPLSRRLKWLNLACLMCIFGIWIEKGMGLVIPGFVPTPLGEMVEYVPTWNETLVCVGIWAFGLLCFTIFLRMSVPILQGELSRANEA